MKKLLALSICASLLVLAGCNKEENTVKNEEYKEVNASQKTSKDNESSSDIKNINDFEFKGKYYEKSFFLDDEKYAIHPFSQGELTVDSDQIATFKTPDGDNVVDFSNHNLSGNTFLFNFNNTGILIPLSISDDHSLIMVQEFHRLHILTKDKDFKAVLDTNIDDFKNKRYHISAQSFNDQYEFVENYYGDENYGFVNIDNEGFFKFDKPVNLSQFLNTQSPLAFRVNNVLFFNMGGYGVKFNYLHIHEGGVLTYYDIGYYGNPHVLYTLTPID